MSDFDIFWISLMAFLAMSSVIFKLDNDPADFSYICFSSFFWISVSIFIVRCFFWEPFVLTGRSMLPTMPPQSIAVINKQAYGFVWPVIRMQSWNRVARKNEIIAFKHNEEIWVKRVVATYNDKVSFNNNGWFVNNQFVSTPKINQEKWINHKYPLNNIKTDSKDMISFDIKVPKGYLLVMGDNKNNSTDSRMIGLVPMESVIGRVDWINKSE